MKIERVCAACGRTYIATSGRQKYCTKACRKAAYARQPKVKKEDDELRKTVREKVMVSKGIKPYDYGKWRLASWCTSSTLGR